MDTSFYRDVLKCRRTQIYKYTHEHTCWSLGVDQEQFGRRQPRLPQIMYIKHWFVLAIIWDGKHYCWGVLCILSLLSKDHLSQQMRKKHYTTRRRKYKLHQTHWAFSITTSLYESEFHVSRVVCPQHMLWSFYGCRVVSCITSLFQKYQREQSRYLQMDFNDEWSCGIQALFESFLGIITFIQIQK